MFCSCATGWWLVVVVVLLELPPQAVSIATAPTRPNHCIQVIGFICLSLLEFLRHYFNKFYIAKKLYIDFFQKKGKKTY
jgi:hypothetical protein